MKINLNFKYKANEKIYSENDKLEVIERAELNANQVNEINIGEEAIEAPELDRASSSLVKIYFFLNFLSFF